MKNFDEARAARAAQDRDFQIGGEPFVVVAGVRPEALAAYDDLSEDTPVAETLRIVDELILVMVEDTPPAEEGQLGAHDRYRMLRSRIEDPLTVEDLQDLAKWLIEAQTGRPTGQPGGSSAGLARTGTILRDVSSSPDTPAS